MMAMWHFRINIPEYLAKLHSVIQKKVKDMVMCFYNFYTWSFFSRILTQMIKIVFDSYMSPYLSPIKYGTTHDNYLKSLAII